jgi:hypothetical protein
VAKGLREALGVERNGRGRGIFGAGDEREKGTAGEVVDLPDEATVAETRAEAGGIGGVGRIEQVDAQRGVGEMEHEPGGRIT